MAERQIYERVGGEAAFRRLVDRFYELVETDPILRPLYPDDLAPGKEHLALFLVQYWGGPGTYSEQRGHPRLRARHMPFRIGAAERDAWLGHMTTAVRELGLDPDVEETLLDYFAGAAAFMVNAEDAGEHRRIRLAAPEATPESERR